MQTCDVDAPPNFPRLGVVVTVETHAVSTTNHEDIRVVNDTARTVSVRSESLESDHVLGVYPRGIGALIELRRLWITVVMRRCLWIDGFAS